MQLARRLVLFLLLPLLLCTEARAQSANCEQVRTESFLNANGVRAKIINNGGLFWNGGHHVYTVGGSDALFTANLLIGGLVDGDLRTSGSTYGPFEFWPGPADSIQTAADCERFNRMYRIALRDINAFEEGGEPPADLLEWPWQLGAPVVDGDGNPDNYDLAGGDRPEILGSEMVYWIMNDVGGTHERTETEPLGIEVHGTAFAAPSSDPALDNATFYRYRIINRSDRPIEETYVGIFVDPDLGAAFDDYIGSDSLASLAYVYNADNDDEGQYGEAPPAVGFRMFDGPEASPDEYDNDYDGAIDEVGERLRMSYFIYYNGGGGVQGDPRNGEEFYGYMRGRWRDGQPITYGGDGRDFSTEPARFMYPADPPDFWSEMNYDGSNPRSPADRRFIQSMGPFALEPGEETELFVGILYARAEDNLASLALLEDYALGMEGLRPEDVASDVGEQPIAEAPRLVAPINASADHLATVTLDWSPVDNGLVYQLRVERTDDATEPRIIDLRSTETTLDLERNARYSWRVRAYSATDYGPWSESRTFTTGPSLPFELVSFADAVVVRNAAGPLAEPEGATADWRGFPGTGPPTDMQQVGPARWLIHTMDGSISGREDFQGFLSRSFRNWTEDAWGTAYEIRFEGESLAYDYWTGNIITVPFEVWSIGRGTPDDPSDDYRMVPRVVDWDEDGFGLSTMDHGVSDEEDDPELDAIYLWEPMDTSPGETGYLEWEEDVLEDPETFTDTGPERIARIALVNWDAGTPGSDDIEQRTPEPGTIFRIYTRPRPAPILNAPAVDAVMTAENAAFQWTVYPPEPVTFEAARDAAFQDVILHVDVPGETLLASSLANLSPGRYYWRVTAEKAGTSETGSYLVGTTVGVEDDAATEAPAILGVYPVPATDEVTVRLRVPGPVRADLSVFDVLGRRVIADDVMLAAGESSLMLSVNRLAPGAYFLEIDIPGASLRGRLVVSSR